MDQIEFAKDKSYVGHTFRMQNEHVIR